MSFHLEKAITTWKQPYLYNRAFSSEDVEELEGSLRDRVEVLIKQGLTEKEAFQTAVRRAGALDTAETEYQKVYWGKLRRERQLKDELIMRLSMIKNYVKVAIRSLRKQKGYAFINVLGLAIGLTCFILIGLFVQYELSYDKFHDKSERIYRIAREIPGKPYLGSNLWTPTPAPLVHALIEELPEVEHATQFAKANSLIANDDKRFYEDGIFATEQFFDVFDFQLLQGDPATVLVDPESIVLTRSLAIKFFGDTHPIGQSISVSHSGEHFRGETLMNVTGIVEDVPANSHFTFDYLVPVTSSRELLYYLDRWDSNNYFTYVSLRPDHSIAEFEAKLPQMAQKHLSQVEYYQANPDYMELYFPQALTDIHLYSKVNIEFGVNGDIKYVYLFSAIALLILLIACINYINLATARSATRFREVGVRKVMGAQRGQLIGQFMSEAILPSVLALLIAIGLVILLLPVFNSITAREMGLGLYRNGGFLAILLLIGLGIGLLAGSYPALMMSSFQPVSMMKGILNRRPGKARLRNVLVVAQFAITIVLIIGTLVIQRQLHYIRNANTGVDRDQVVAMQIKDQTLHEHFPALKQTLLSYPNILGVTAAQSDPTGIDSSTPATEWEGVEEGQSILVHRSAIRYDFLDLFDLELVEGRDFSEAMATDEEEGILINETLKRQLGWDTAVGKRFNFRDRTRIIGVVKDFNFHSFHLAVAPLALTLESGWWFPYQRIYVKAGVGEMQETISFLEKTMADFSPEYPFEYYFLDDAYNQMYQTETRLGSLLSYFTFLALFIACMGLLGLAAFMAQQRTKEIGVRKVLGATQSNILFLLSKDFTRLVLIAFALAAPVGYVALNRWLQEFAYGISVGWGTFAIAGSAVLLVAWLTVSVQSMRAALADPVKSLKHE